MSELGRCVERALALRHPGARITWRRGPDEAPPAARAFLEIAPVHGGAAAPSPVGIVDGDVSRAVLDGFLTSVVERYRADAPFTEARLVYTGAVQDGVAAEARRRGVRLESLRELQDLLDFGPYLEQQTRAIERDPIYPSALFVPQGIAYRAGFEALEADDALEALDAWLGQEGPQLLLVLGDFGTGKTFLLRELALRLGRRAGAVVPILVELRRLEKSRSLDALLGQHFIPARGVTRFDHAAFRYMLEEGRVALLFDGFDELALRVTYAAAAEHLDAVLQAATGRAKVVITSRTQHFLSDRQVLQALGRRAEERGFRMMRLQPFDDRRIHQFLVRRFGDDAVAQRRLELLAEVRDLLGLSHNPRMLGFIAEIDEHDLRQAARGGAITSAALYRVLLERWLGHEVQRDHPPGIEPGIPAAARWRAATELARLLWVRRERTIAVGDIPPALLDEVARLSERALPREAAAFKVGSGTLLGRDEEGRFSFIHQSVVEWLVANEIATDLRDEQPPPLLAAAPISDLMADFLWSLAGMERVLAWARDVLAVPPSELLAANATRLLRRVGHGAGGLEARAAAGGARATEARLALGSASGAEARLTGAGGNGIDARSTGEPARGDGDAARAQAEAGVSLDVVADLSGHDLRGRDFSGTRHLRGARLEAADLSEASLVRADLSGASLARARLRRANLEGASLAGADLRGADLSFARLLGADLTGAVLEGAVLRYAALVGARVELDALQRADRFGAAPPRPDRLDVATGVHLVPCGAVAWSPDGDLLVSGYQDGTVLLRDAGTGAVLRTLSGHAAEIRCLACSPDGRLLASGAADHEIRLWSPDSGRLLRVLSGHAAAVRSLAFSPDGRLLASGAADGTVAWWSPETGQLLRVLAGSPHELLSLALSPMLEGSAQDLASLALASALEPLLRVLASHAPPIRSLAFSPDDRLVASSSADAKLRLWSRPTGQLLRTLEGHAGLILSLAFSPDGRLLASGSADHTVRLWSTDTGRLRRVLEGHTGLVRSVAFSPDGRGLASGSADHTVRLWSADTGQPRRVLESRSTLAPSLALSPDRRILVSGSADRSLRLWQLETGRLLHALEGHAAAILSVAFSTDGQLLASGSTDNTILLWNPDAGQLLRAIESHSDAVLALAFSPDARLLASSSADHSIQLASPDTGKLLRRLDGPPCASRGLAFSPDGQLLASSSDDNHVRLWNPHTGKLLRSLEGHTAPVWPLAFSADGTLLASGSHDHTIRLWSPHTGRLLRTLDGHVTSGFTLALSPTGLLASGSHDHTIRLWRPDTGRLLRTLDGHTASIWTIACSADGRLLASTSADGTLRLWNIQAALLGTPDPCLAVLIPGRHGWVAYASDGRYKASGDITALVGLTSGLCRFAPGELDAYPSAFDHPPRRIAEDEPLFTLDL